MRQLSGQISRRASTSDPENMHFQKACIRLELSTRAHFQSSALYMCILPYHESCIDPISAQKYKKRQAVPSLLTPLLVQKSPLIRLSSALQLAAAVPALQSPLRSPSQPPPPAPKVPPGMAPIPMRQLDSALDNERELTRRSSLHHSSRSISVTVPSLRAALARERLVSKDPSPVQRPHPARDGADVCCSYAGSLECIICCSSSECCSSQTCQCSHGHIHGRPRVPVQPKCMQPAKVQVTITSSDMTLLSEKVKADDLHHAPCQACIRPCQPPPHMACGTCSRTKQRAPACAAPPRCPAPTCVRSSLSKSARAACMCACASPAAVPGLRLMTRPLCWDQLHHRGMPSRMQCSSMRMLRPDSRLCKRQKMVRGEMQGRVLGGRRRVCARQGRQCKYLSVLGGPHLLPPRHRKRCDASAPP